MIHDYDTEVYFPYPWYLRVADRLLAPTTPTAIAASPMVRDFLVRKRKIGRERIRIMLHAVPPEKYASVSRERVQAIKALLGVDGPTRIIGTVTKLGPQRGNEYVLSAAAAALKVFPNLLFLIVYKPTYFHRLPNQSYVPVSGTDIQGKAMDLESLAETLGIRRNVRFIEWPENGDAWISACDLIVAPFLSDRFSSVHLLEAMAMGKPVVATDVGEQREIIDHGIDGYLVSPGDVKEMTERILQLLTKPEALDQMSRSARAKAEQYSADAYVENLERLYAELAANTRSNQAQVRRRFA
jgi:glycosyltransferase involved in cell wall biosynthesis